MIKRSSTYVVFPHVELHLPLPFYTTIHWKNEIKMLGKHGKMGSKFQGPRLAGPPCVVQNRGTDLKCVKCQTQSQVLDRLVRGSSHWYDVIRDILGPR